jgi:hypothetical protein
LVIRLACELGRPPEPPIARPLRVPSAVGARRRQSRANELPALVLWNKMVSENR